MSDTRTHVAIKAELYQALIDVQSATAYHSKKKVTLKAMVDAAVTQFLDKNCTIKGELNPKALWIY